MEAEKAVLAFQPFEHTFICPGCNRPLAIMVQPVHLDIAIDCPRCGRSLTGAIRKEIRQLNAS